MAAAVAERGVLLLVLVAVERTRLLEEVSTIGVIIAALLRHLNNYRNDDNYNENYERYKRYRTPRFSSTKSIDPSTMCLMRAAVVVALLDLKKLFFVLSPHCVRTRVLVLRWRGVCHQYIWDNCGASQQCEAHHSWMGFYR